MKVIVIANTAKMEEDLEKFNEYKEKLIDYHFRIDSIDLSLLKNIANQAMKHADEDTKILVSKVYYEIVVRNLGERQLVVPKNSLNILNIRVYKKYLFLVDSVLKKVKEDYSSEAIKIDEDILSASIRVVIEDFLEKSDLNKSFTHSERFIYNAIKKIYLCQPYDKQEIEEYLIKHSQISKDIKNLYQMHRLGVEEFESILKRVDNNISKSNLDYFKKQELVISLYDALIRAEVFEHQSSKIEDIASELYKPDILGAAPQFDLSDWIDVDYAGDEIPCDPQLEKLIANINRMNKKTKQIFITQEFEEALQKRDFNALQVLLKQMPINFEVFTELFELAFKALEVKFDEEIWSLLKYLTQKGDERLVKEFLDKRYTESISMPIKARYRELVYLMDEAAYYEGQYVDYDNE